MSRLAIVIVSFNTRGALGDCLRSLHDPPPRIDHDIVVVDNGSTDGSVDAVRSDWPRARVIELERNEGYARATNAAIRASTGALILLLNSDTVVPPGGVDRLVDALAADADAAIVGPRLIDAEGHVELSFGRMITPWNEARQKIRGFAARRRLPLLAARVERAAATTHYPDWVSGACLLVRRDDAEAVGLLDERFFLYAEDVDFCAAVRGRGRRVLFTPTVDVGHARGRSGARAPAATHAAYRRSHLAFYAKHHPAWTPLLRLYLRLRGQLPEG